MSSEVGFKSLSPKREVLSLGLCAKMDPFPVAPLAVGPFVPFASENVQIGWPTFEKMWTGFEKLIKSSLCFHTQVWAEKAVHGGNAALPLVHEEPEQPVELLRGKVQQGTKQAAEQG